METKVKRQVTSNASQPREERDLDFFRLVEFSEGAQFPWLWILFACGGVRKAPGTFIRSLRCTAYPVNL